MTVPHCLGTSMELRAYQSANVAELRDGYRSGIRRQLLASPTGSGKTVLFAFVTQNAVSKGNRVMILAHRREILAQISKTLTQVGVDHGMIEAGKRPDPSKVVHVASVQSLVRRFDKIDVPDFVIIDEAHHAAASTWEQVFARYPESKFLGVTATPERLDGKGLSSFFDKLVLGPSVQWLIDNKFLAKPIYYAPERMVDVSGLRKTAGEFNSADSEQLMDKPTITGDAVDHYRRHATGRRAIAFCVTLAHAAHVAETFNRAAIPAGMIEGEMTKDARIKVIEDLASGAIKVLTSCEIVSEGFDLPAVGAAILLRPTTSLAMHLQQVGRSLRPAADKPNAIILDHVGNCLRHGLAEEERVWSLHGDAKKRRKAGANPTRCERCFALFTEPKCPQCGWNPDDEESETKGSREIDQVDGNLKQLTAEDMKAKRFKRIEESACKTYEDFVQLGKQRGYKPGWAWWRWKNRKPKPQIIPGPRSLNLTQT